MFGFFKKKSEPKELKAMVNGEVISVTEVKDDVFSSCMLGKGIAMEGTNHAVGIRIAEGFDLLIHIGLDTVSLNGEGFTSHISMGQKVKAGDKLITFDKALVESKGLCSDVILIALDNPALPALDFKTGMTASAGETVVATW